MRSNMKPIASAMLLLIMAPSPSWSSEPKTAAGAIAAERAWVRALQAHDPLSLRKRFAPEFLHINWRGELLTRTETLAAAAAAAPASDTLSELNVRRIGDVAVVHGLNAVKSLGRRNARVRFTDVFVYRRGAWRAISAQETLLR